MSEKNEAGLNKVDTQAVIAAWIVANDGCGGNNHVDCYGEKGVFKGTVCQFCRYTGCIAFGDAKVEKAKAWLEKYHQQKAEADQAEGRKAEAAKKEEQETKQEPARICGNCKYIHEVDKSENMIAQCDMKNRMVPILFDRCPDFEPRAAADQSGYPFGEGGVDAAAYAERVARRKKDTEELCDLVELYAAAYAGLKRAAAETKKDRADLTAKCERLTEQRNRLSNSLVEAMRRIKEIENGGNILAQKIVDSVARLNRLSDLCNENDGLIDRLKREVANILTDRSIMEGKMQLYVSPFRQR